MSTFTRLATVAFGIVLQAVVPTWLAAQGPAAPTPTAQAPAAADKVVDDRRRADGLFDAGKIEEARSIYERLAPSFADDFEFNRRLAYCFFISPKKEMAEAARYYAIAYRLNPKDTEVEMDLAKSYSWSQQYNAAIPIFRRIIARDPSNPEAWLELARAQNNGGQGQLAGQSYQYYLKRWYNDQEVRLEYAAYLESRKQYEPALEQYRGLLKSDRNNLKARLGEAEVLFLQGMLQESLDVYDGILRSVPKRYEALRGKGFILFRMDRYDEANSFFAQANQQRPPDRDIQEAMGLIARAKTGQLAPDQGPAQGPAPAEQNEFNSLRQRAEDAMEDKNYPLAINLLQQAITLAPSDSALRIRLGQAYLFSGQADTSIQTFQRLYGEQPDNLAALEELGNAQMAARRFDDAAKSYRAYLQFSPDPVVRLKLAQALSDGGKYADAIPIFQQALQSDPGNFNASIGLASVYSWHGELGKALDIYDSLLNQKPGNRDALLGKAKALNWSGNIDESFQILEGMNKSFPDDPEISGLLQSVREAQLHGAGQPRPAPAAAGIDERIRTAEAALAQNPRDATNLRNLGELFAQGKDYKQASSYFERALALQPDDAAVRLRLAQSVSSDFDFPRAMSLYQGWIAQDPDNREYRIEFGRILTRTGRYAEAIEQYKEVLNRNPRDLISRNALASVLAWTNQFEESLKETGLVLQADPQNWDALMEQARVLAWNGRYDDAIASYDKLLALVPNDQDAKLGKAEALTWSGREREAKELLGKLP